MFAAAARSRATSLLKLRPSHAAQPLHHARNLSPTTYPHRSNTRHLSTSSITTSPPTTEHPPMPHLTRSSPPTTIATTVARNGYAVIRSLFSPSLLCSLNSDLDPHLTSTLPGQPSSETSNSTIPSDPAVRAFIFGASTKRVDHLIARSSTFRSLADDAVFHGICEKLFAATGDYWLSTAQMIDIGPGSAAGPLHPDAGLWSMLLGLDDKKAPEVAVNFLVAASKTTVANGATGVVEGSHLLPMGEVLGDVGHEVWRTPEEEVKQIELEVGDCLLVGGKIWHRGGANTTEGERRRVLSLLVTSCALTPEEAHPSYVDKGTAEELGPRARKLLGFEGLRPAVGAGFWRQ